MRFALLMFLLAVSSTAAQEPVPRTPVPDDATQKAATALAADVYKRDLDKSKTPALKIELAKKLLADAIETKDDAVSRFVLFRLARDMSAQQGDLSTALEAIRHMSLEFDVDRLQMQVDTAATGAKSPKPPKDKQAYAALLVPLIDEAIDADRYEVAKALAALALGCERDGRDANRIKSMTARAKEIDEIAVDHEKMKAATAVLEAKPNDPAANLTVGKFLSFVKGDWKRGVARLALGNDESLQSVALLELEANPDALQLGDGWWKVSESLAGTAQLRTQSRAAEWYRKALPELGGLTKVRVERLLETSRAAATSQSGSPTTAAKNATPKSTSPNRPATVPPEAVSWQGRWYWFPEDKVSFDEALAAALKRKGRLLTISSAEENDFVRGHLLGPTHLGLKKVKGRWLMSDGSPQQYFNWAPGQPQSGSREDWIAIHQNGQWHDYLQSRLYYAVEWGKE